VEVPKLDEAVAGIVATGAQAIGVVTDVTDGDAVDRLRDAAIEGFGRVHVLCNNAGVAGTGPSGGKFVTEAEWRWVIDVNLWGVIHGHRAFLPHLVEHGDGHIVNTASMAGLLTAANPYNVSKHGVVCLTEGIYKDFREMGARLSASVVCPGLINTRILEAERNRDLGTPTDVSSLRDDLQRFTATFEAALRGGYPPDVVAEAVLDGIREDRFYVFPAQPFIVEQVHDRMQAIIEGRNPTPR